MTPLSIVLLVGGVIALVLGAEALIRGATRIAARTGLSTVVIGLTVVAFGTSAPELAVSVGDVVRGGDEAGGIALGNVVGSNILNILAVLAVPGLIHATDIDYAALWRDSGMMLALTLMLALFAYGLNSRTVITRFEGSIMLMAWMGYNLLLIQQA